MDEFDAFATPASPAEEDPAADFLAREQSELAGLEDDAPVENLGGGLLGEENAFAGAPGDMMMGGDAMMMGGDDQLAFGGAGGEASAFEETNGPSETNGLSDAYSSISQQDTERAEPEKLRVWREEHAKRLEQKDAAEEKDKEEWRKKAKKELDDWYKHHAEQLQKTQGTNREAEEAFVKDRDEKNPGQAWEKVTRLCEFNPKHSRNTKDVSRMRSILLQLKQTPLVR